jgi:hypothetical protein
MPTNKMKRQAVDTLQVHAMDRQGNPMPMASAAAYELRSVAVPWGNCIEPSNVKAGGAACPVRFQCSGCGSYRPDPSHLPAIEDQLRSLRADLELARAMSAADYTIKGLEGEIADYMNVIKKDDSEAGVFAGRRAARDRAGQQGLATPPRRHPHGRAGQAAYARRASQRDRSVTAQRRPADVLREARKRDSLTKRARVLAVVDGMKATDEPITFLGVAKAAEVSNWLVYAAGVREHIEAARRGQLTTRCREHRSGKSAGTASLAVDLELARAELRRVRDERDRLKATVQRSLGQQVIQTGNIVLEKRIRELGDQAHQSDAALTQARAQRDEL